MITTALITLGAILLVVAVVVFVFQLAHAPVGVEDETGFHAVKARRKVRNRYYSARSAEHDTAKAIKAHHIPAA